MNNPKQMIKKLQRAINDKFNETILVNNDQFYSEEQKRAIDIYSVKKCFIDDNGKKTYVELFKSASNIQIVLWLRDYWYQLNGWDVPTDNKEWNEAKTKYEQKQNKKKNGGVGK